MRTAARSDVHRIMPAEWATLRKLRLDALRDTPQAFLGTLEEEAERDEAEWRRLASDRAWLVATLDAEAAGIASVVRHPVSADCYVESMWVDPRFRRRGVATALLEGASGIATEIGRRELLLWVLEGNSSAGATYQRYGFGPTGKRQYVPGRPGLLETEYVYRIPSVEHAGNDFADSGLDGVRQGPHDLQMDALRRVPDDVH
jgi:GNAT superfamily N-acetyltransferase